MTPSKKVPVLLIKLTKISKHEVPFCPLGVDIIETHVHRHVSTIYVDFDHKRTCPWSFKFSKLFIIAIYEEPPPRLLPAAKFLTNQYCLTEFCESFDEHLFLEIRRRCRLKKFVLWNKKHLHKLKINKSPNRYLLRAHNTNKSLHILINHITKRKEKHIIDQSVQYNTKLHLDLVYELNKFALLIFMYIKIAQLWCPRYFLCMSWKF